MKEAEITNEIVKPSFNEEIIVNIPKDMPEITHNLDKLEAFAKSLKVFYTKLIFSDDRINEATNERKKINSLIETVKRLRIDKVKEYKKPIENFEATAKNIESLLDEAKDSIQIFIDKAEEKRKDTKRKESIEPIINNLVSDAFIKGYLINKNEIIIDNRWYNKTYKEADIEKDVSDQINELIRQQNEFNQGVEIIKSTLEAYNNLNAYDKYIERFKYTKDLTSILSDIKEEAKNVKLTINNNNKPLAVELNDLSMFDDTAINVQKVIAEYTIKVRGTVDQFAHLKEFIKNIGMEEI